MTTNLAGGGVAAGAGNIIAGGIVGTGIVAYNGANTDHSPNPVDVTLRPAPTVLAPAARKGAPLN